MVKSNGAWGVCWGVVWGRAGELQERMPWAVWALPVVSSAMRLSLQWASGATTSRKQQRRD